MSSNCIDYGRKSGRMKIEDLTVGQTLIRVSSPTWSPANITMTRWTIKKILKTRLVIANERGAEVRILVQFSKNYPFRNGEVSQSAEGQGPWSREHYTLYTTDDPALQDFADRARVAKAKLDAENALKTALENLTRTSTSLEAVDSAIASLEAYRVFLTSEES